MIEVGHTLTRTIKVDAARTIDFMGPDARVYATPSMISDVEMLCRDMILPMVEQGQDSVGMRVVMDHLGSALLGNDVVLEATITSVEGRRVSFDATMTCNDKKIGVMQHMRGVVAIADLKARLAQKK